MKKISKPPREKINPRELQKSYMQRIEEDVKERGVTLISPDNYLNIEDEYLVLPREVTEVPSKELGELLNAYTQQKVYMRTILGQLELVVEETKRAYFTATEPHYKRYSGERLSETAKDRIINSIEGVKPLYEEYNDAVRKKSLVEITIANIEDIIFMLSREVTRRNADFDTDSRNYSVGRR